MALTMQFEPLWSWQLKHSVPTILVLSFSALALITIVLYRAALPKPIPGIPYLPASAKNVFGDIPAMIKHITSENGTFITYIVNTLKELDAPLVQVFIRPFAPPLLVMADFREAQDLMTRRNDWDRSSSSGDLVKALAPEHHIHLKTGPAFRTQRRLIQDLMTPAFLHSIAGPAIYDRTSAMIELWHEKARIASGRPWVAGEDIDHVVLDAVVAFAFGDTFPHSATAPELKLMRSLDDGAIDALRAQSPGLDDPFSFPSTKLNRVLRAVLNVTATVEEVQGSPLPDLKWWWVLRQPRIKEAMSLKEDCIHKELQKAVNLMEMPSGASMKSAVDHMIQQEKKLAEKEGRKPNYFSRVMIDEVFGFVVAGHDTTGTTICWGLKYLAENGSVQKTLRDALQAAFPAAVAEVRAPDIREITSKQIPYLSAVLEETLRCAGTVPIVDRQALVDTELLGHQIPRGAVVSSLVTGPSMTSEAFHIDEKRRRANGDSKSAARAWDPLDSFAFKPERWLVPGTAEFDGAAGPQLAFGLGGRQCYGKRLANLELKIVFTLIVWNFALLPTPEELSGHHPVLVMTSRPRDCYVRLQSL